MKHFPVNMKLAALAAAFLYTAHADWIAVGPTSRTGCQPVQVANGRSTGGTGVSPVQTISNAGLERRLPASSGVRIRELARSLDLDWRRCFDFVRDSILFEPYFGILRGAERTLIDRVGNDADQSLLLVALLRECGVSATVMYMPCSNDGTSGFMVPLSSATNPGEGCTAAEWLGVGEAGDGSNICERVSKTISAFQRPCYWRPVPAFPRWEIITDHFWVAAEIGGETLHLDPSFKPCVSRPARDAAADMGYSRTALLSAAGGVADSTSAGGLSGASVDSALDGWSAALEAAWTNANAAAADFIGVRAVAPQGADAPLFSGTILSGVPIDFLAQSDSFKNSFRAEATMAHGGENCTFFLDEVDGRILWMSYETADGGALRGVFRAEDDVVWSDLGAAGAYDALGLSVTLNGTWTSASYIFHRAASSVYVVPVDFGGDVRGGMRKAASERFMAERTMSGDGAGRTVARSLALLGASWHSQTAAADRFANQLLGDECRALYSTGVAGQDGSPFVDMRNAFFCRTGDLSRFCMSTFFRSALEHSILNQLCGADVPTVSTVRLLAMANASGAFVYLADADNWASVAPLLTGHSQAQLDSLYAQVQSGYSVLVADGPALSAGSWTGRGWMERKLSDSYSHMQMMISGGLNGGYLGVIHSIGGYDAQNCAYFANISTISSAEASAADPVALPSGALVSSVRDLTVSAGHPLSWTRRYDSRARDSSGGMGRGWTHGFAATVRETTDVSAAFGDGSVSAAIPTAVATTIAADLFAAESDSNLSNGERARRLLLAALVADWWTRRAANSSAAVDLGDRALLFHRRPDGSYAPPPGVTASLERTGGGGWSLAERNGPSYTFDASNRLERIVDVSGNATTLSYGMDGLLSRVENGFGAAFNVAWTNGLLSGVTDSAGRSVSYAYDASGLLTNVTDAAGKPWRMEYDAATGALASSFDPDGNETFRNRYNSSAQITNQTTSAGGEWNFGYAADMAWDADPLGNRQTQTFDADGHPLSRTARDGGATTAIYDGHGHAVTNIDAVGRIRAAEYDARDNLVRVIDGTGTLQRVTSLAYDSSDRLASVTNAMGGVAEFEYDSAGRVMLIRFADGTYVEREWTATGLLASESLVGRVIPNTPSGGLRAGRPTNAPPFLRTEYSYGANGLPVSRTTTGDGLPPNGIAETFAWDEAGNLISRTDGEGRTTSFSYDASGRIVSRTEALGGVTAYAYSDSGFLTNVTDAAGRSSAILRTPSGMAAAVVLPDGSISTNIYDAADRLAAAVDPRGGSVVFVRDAEGRVVSRSSQTGVASVAYDLAGFPVAVTNAAGESASFVYDGFGDLASATDGLGAVQEAEHDALGRLAAVRDPLGRMRRFGHDAMGRRIWAMRPSGATDRFAYDAAGRLVSFTNAAGRVHTLVRDALGRVLSEIDGEGRTLFSAAYDNCGNMTNYTGGTGVSPVQGVNIAYDALNRPTSRAADGIADSFSWSATGELLSASNSVAAESFAYDSCGRLSSAVVRIGTNSCATAWLRDAGGLATNVSYGAGMSVSREYDSDGRLVAVRDWLGHEWTFSWDGEGRPLGGTSPDGRAHSLQYDAAGRLSAWSVDGVAGRSIVRDAAGRRKCDTVTAGAMPVPARERRAQNVFDGAGRIVSADVESGTNAPIHEVYSHDACGAVTNVTADGETVFAAEYDELGRITTLDCGGLGAGRPTNSPPFTCAYDALGNRVRIGERIFVPDHDDPLKRPLLECDENGAPVRAYIWGAGRLLGWLDFAESSMGGPRSGAANGRAASPLAASLTIAHCDEQGSVVALASADGAIIHTAHYGPHGEDWGVSGDNPSPFAWLGGLGVMRMGGLGFVPAAASTFSPLYLTRHRLYAPSLRRFLSSDPLGLSGGLNLFAYCAGDPLSYVDPLGLCAETSSFMKVLASVGTFAAKAFDFIWNTGLEFATSNPNFREAGIQQPIYNVILAQLGSPMMRLGAYENRKEPLAADGDLVNATWDLGAAATAYKNIGAQGTQIVNKSPEMRIDLLPENGTTKLYHGGRLTDGSVNGRGFSTTTDFSYAEEYAELRGGVVFMFEVPNRFINENAIRKYDNLSGAHHTGEEYYFFGPNVNKLNIFMLK